MIRNDIREKHEEEYKEDNEKPLSICSGRFYVANRKQYIYCNKCSKCQKNKRYHMRIEDVPEVKFKHTESFRRCKLYEQVINDDFVKTISIFNVLAVNDLACSSILELLDFVTKKDKETLSKYRALHKRMIIYKKKVNKIVEEFANSDDFANFNNLVEDENQPLIEKIYDMVEEELHLNGFKDSDYLARVEIAKTLVDYSVDSLRMRVKECRRYGINLLPLHDYELKDVQIVLEDFSNWAFRKVKGVDLAKEKFMNVMNELGKSLTDYSKLTNFINQTIDKDSIEQQEKQ